jgi:hydroxymethylpyrimidine/phosphomethylpyrimidine kinase
VSAAVLVVAGVDSSGGAGIVRDLATAHELGAAVRVAVTAVTAQDDRGLQAVHHMPPDVVAAQIAACGPIGAIKIGMLGTAATLTAVAGALPDQVPVVLDPVLSSSSGYRLLDPAGLQALVTRLLPRIDLLTPNLPELAAFGTLFGLPGDDEAAIVGALQRAGSPAVLVKGGHDDAARDCEDRLYLREGDMLSFSSQRFPMSLRGTGCQLATGIAVQLARGDALADAIVAARRSVENRFMAAG